MRDPQVQTQRQASWVAHSLKRRIRTPRPGFTRPHVRPTPCFARGWDSHATWPRETADCTREAWAPRRSRLWVHEAEFILRCSVCDSRGAEAAQRCFLQRVAIRPGSSDGQDTPVRESVLAPSFLEFCPGARRKGFLGELGGDGNLVPAAEDGPFSYWPARTGNLMLDRDSYARNGD